LFPPAKNAALMAKSANIPIALTKPKTMVETLMS
jgi:hypothetical protein